MIPPRVSNGRLICCRETMMPEPRCEPVAGMIGENCAFPLGCRASLTRAWRCAQECQPFLKLHVVYT